MAITAPFNFVPLNDKVLSPSWANQISQDIPFEDGLSGVIDLSLKAESPIFVRNGHTKQDADAKNITYKTFSQTPDNQYFIPGTSLKGSIRSVLEILSLGKMNRISHHRYAIRDLNLKQYTNYLQQHTVLCGWMRKSGGQIIVENHGEPFRVSHLDIDSAYATDFVSTFEKGNTLDDTKKLAQFKYRLFGNNSLRNTFTQLPLDPKNPKDVRKKIRFDKNGDIEGELVFTGQASTRSPKTKLHKAEGKFYEFVFPTECYDSYECGVDDDQSFYKDFLFVYDSSEDWKYWRKKLDQGKKVPVFFVLKNNKIDSLGLSYLYKLPGLKSVYDMLPADHRSSKPDLAECIFGNLKMRGRVQFGNAFCTSDIEGIDEYSPYMGSPKPSYYPIYLQQSLNKEGTVDSYKTMLEQDAQLRGRKRYPIRKHVKTNFPIPDGQENNTNPFIPMPQGSTFTCKVRFHNLKPQELGALLKALNPSTNSVHSIGFAKAFGYGRLRINIASIRLIEAGNVQELDLQAQNEYKKSFDACMQNEEPKYPNIVPIKTLLCMMEEQELNSSLEYMELKDFSKNKGQNNILLPYTDLIKQKTVEVKTEAYETEATVILTTPLQVKINGFGNKNYTVEKKAQVRLKLGDKILVNVTQKNRIIINVSFIKKI